MCIRDRVMPTVYGYIYKKTGKCKALLVITMLLVCANCFMYGLFLAPTTSLGMIYFISVIGGLGHASCVTPVSYTHLWKKS